MSEQGFKLDMKMIWQSIQSRGLWSGINLVLLLLKIRTKSWFGKHHKILLKAGILGLFVAACYTAYWVLTGEGRIDSPASLWGVTVLLASSLAGVIVSLAQLILQRVYRRQILMRSIQFVFYATVVGGLGYLGFDSWAGLYAKQPAEATLLALVVAVVLYGLTDTASMFARSLLVNNMAAADLRELPSLSEEGKYRAGIHEAGHVLCYGLCEGVPEDAYVVIEQDLNDLIGGKVNLPVPREPTDFTKPHIEWELLMLMAGVAAEEEILGEGSMLGGGDMSGFNTHAAIYLMAGHGEVFEMSPDNERDVEVNRAAIRRLREEYRGYARRFIRENRDLVESLARELSQLEYMDCEQISVRVGKVVKPEGHVPVRWPASLPLYLAN